jgi:hypothetical protein
MQTIRSLTATEVIYAEKRLETAMSPNTAEIIHYLFYLRLFGSSLALESLKCDI